MTSEALLIVELASLKVTDANTAASDIFERPASKLAGCGLRDLFDAAFDRPLQELVHQARMSGRAEPVRLLTLSGGRMVEAIAMSFRSDNTGYLLVRLLSDTAGSPGAVARADIADLLKRMPEAFVVIDQDRRILEANDVFLELAELATPEQARGQRIDRWLGRPGVDIELIVSNLREHGALRDFATILRGDHHGQEEVEVTAVSALDGLVACYGLAIRTVRSRAALVVPKGAVGVPRALENLTELVGRVSLKELVRETTDMVEQMCIEAALELTHDNRASAAQILGLSRQGLYAKLRRYGIDDQPVEPDEG